MFTMINSSFTKFYYMSLCHSGGLKNETIKNWRGIYIFRTPIVKNMCNINILY